MPPLPRQGLLKTGAWTTVLAPPIRWRPRITTTFWSLIQIRKQTFCSRMWMGDLRRVSKCSQQLKSAAKYNQYRIQPAAKGSQKRSADMSSVTRAKKRENRQMTVCYSSTFLHVTGGVQQRSVFLQVNNLLLPDKVPCNKNVGELSEHTTKLCTTKHFVCYNTNATS